MNCFQVGNSWLRESNLIFSQWNDTFDPNITITLSGIPLQRCAWNINDINLQIFNASLPGMNLTMKNTNDRLSTFGDLPRSSIENSSILHFKALGIYLEASNISLINTSMLTSAVLYLTDSKALISHSEFKNSKVEGVTESSFVVLNNSRVQIQDSSFVLNSVAYAIITALQSNISIIGSNFEGNKAPHGGTITVHTHSELVLNSCLFHNNNGGAISGYYYVTIAIQNCTFTNNMAVGEVGGAVLAEYDSSVSVTSSVFDNNTADLAAAIQVDHGGYLHTSHSGLDREQS